MAQPPLTVQLPAGTHYLCACGRSQNAPYCDGAHQGTQFQPLAIELEVPQAIEISGVTYSQAQAGGR